SAAGQNCSGSGRGWGRGEPRSAPPPAPRLAGELSAARLDGSEVRLESLQTDLPGLHVRLKEHLAARIRDGVKLMKSMLAIAPWGEGEAAKADFREQGVVILLAGNSSRSAFVEQALAAELGIPDLAVWRPDAPDAAS